MPLRFPVVAPGVYNQPLTIRHLLDANILSASMQEIVYRDQVRMTYADLRERIARLATMLEKIGVEQGTTVGILDWDSHRYLEAFFAVPMIGAVLQTANIRLSPEQLRYTLSHAGAEVLLVHHDFLPLVEAMRAELPRVRVVVALMDGASDPIPVSCVGEYEAMIAACAPREAFDDFDENALATTFYTSGTTGLPKAVCFSHRQLVLHTLAIATAFGTSIGPGLRRDDVYMPLTPMFHVHAWGLPYAATMLGLRQVYPGRYEAERICRMRREEGVTFSHCVPTILQMLLAAARKVGERLDGWHFVIGGSPLNRDLYDAATAMGADITIGYGMSETGPIVAVGRTGTDRYDAIRTGMPIPLVSAQIVDPNMLPLPADDEALGELVLRAPWLTCCYVNDPSGSETLWRGGWLHTQDVAAIAPNGSIQIRDRLKDVIKTGGEWICSLSLEELILARDDVAEVAVVGVPDPKWQERPVAMVVPSPENSPNLQEIRNTLLVEVLSGKISKFAIVDEIMIVDHLPRTSVGKIDKKAIRELFEKRTLNKNI